MRYKFSDLYYDDTKNAKKLKSSEYKNVGKHIIVDQGKALIAGYTDNEDGLYTDVPVIIFGDHTRNIKYINSPFFLGADGTKVLKSPLKNVNYKYLYYLLKNASIPDTGYNRHYKWLKELMFKYHSQDQQNQIVTILDKLDLTISKYREELLLLDELVKARFVEMFGDPIENQKDWEVVKIRDIVTDVRYGTSKPAVEGGRYPYLRMNNLTVDGGLDLSDLKYIDIPDNEIEKCVVRKGDILFNRTNSIDLIGKTAVFNLLDDMVIAGYIIRIRLNNQILPDVFSQYMNLEAMKKVLRGMAKGAVNQANINAQELQSIKVYIPNMELQKQYVEFKEEIDKSRLRELLAIKQIKLLLNDFGLLFY